jgi:hypothetical protein
MIIQTNYRSLTLNVLTRVEILSVVILHIGTLESISSNAL